MIETIQKQERRNRGYGILKYFRGKTVKSQAVNEINIPTSWTKREKNDNSPLEDPKKLYSNTPNKKDISNDHNWITIKTPAEILLWCREKNRQHFGQAFSEGTPFTREPLSTRFSWNAQTHEARMVLEGTYDSTDETELQKMFSQHLKRVTPIDRFNERVNIKDFKKAMRKWKERRSTSPSGRHLGHYRICICQIDRKLDPEVRTRLLQLQDKIADLYVTMINYATKHNYSFD